MTILKFDKYILKCSGHKDGLKGMCCIFNLHFTRGRIAFAHFLQLAMVSFAHFLRFHLRTIFIPQSVLSCRETMTDTGNHAGEMRI